MLHIFVHLLFESALELVGVVEKIFDGAKLRNEFLRRFLPHPGTTRNVVGRVAHESEQVNHLQGRREGIFLAHLFHAEHLHRRTAMPRAAHLHMLANKLGVILGGRDHPPFQSGFCRAAGHRSDDVVGLKARHLEDGDVVGTNDVFDDGHGAADVLRRLFALRLVFWIGIVAERRTRGVEGHGDVRGGLLLQHFLKRVDKAIDRRCVLALGIHPRGAYQSIVSPVNKGVSIK